VRTRIRGSLSAREDQPVLQQSAAVNCGRIAKKGKGWRPREKDRGPLIGREKTHFPHQKRGVASFDRKKTLFRISFNGGILSKSSGGKREKCNVVLLGISKKGEYFTKCLSTFLEPGLSFVQRGRVRPETVEGKEGHSPSKNFLSDQKKKKGVRNGPEKKGFYF